METDKSAITLSPNPLLWSDGTKFNGFLILGLGYPTVSSIPISSVGILTSTSFERLPKAIKHIIKDGKLLNNKLSIYRSDKILPSGSRYYAYYYDLSGRLVAPTMGTATALNINSAAYTLITPALAIPIASTISPTFETSFISTPIY